MHRNGSCTSTLPPAAFAWVCSGSGAAGPWQQPGKKSETSLSAPPPASPFPAVRWVRADFRAQRGALVRGETSLFAAQLRPAAPVCASAFIYSLSSAHWLGRGRPERDAVPIRPPTLPAPAHHLYSRAEVPVPQRTAPSPPLGIRFLPPAPLPQIPDTRNSAFSPVPAWLAATPATAAPALPGGVPRSRIWGVRREAMPTPGPLGTGRGDERCECQSRPFLLEPFSSRGWGG